MFLKDEFGDLYIECKEMEDLIINNNYIPAIIACRRIMEKMVNKIFILEYEQPRNEDLIIKLTYIYRKHYIDYKTSDKCHKIRKLGNLANHDDVENPQLTAFECHQSLFHVLKFFYEKYNDSINPIKINPYTGAPTEKKDNTQIDELIEELKRRGLTIGTNNPSYEELDQEKESEYDYTPINGSFLLGELTRLKNSSQEAVESHENLSNFKKYLHVKRDIQEELENKIEESIEKNSNKLILLCGSVGDGKSHLLSYLNENRQDLMDKFEVINDATESADPQKTSIDRLAKKLYHFNDENINKNNKKLILSINLGVLNNFIDSDYAKKEYTILSSIFNELNIFDVNDFSNNFDKDPVSIISFSDNNLFEFDANAKYNVSSEYISQLFSKITNEEENNPFYQAFKKDLENGYNSPIIYNYNLFCLKEVQDIIINNLIKIIIKYKKIISTRDLLNFIYEIIVPSNIIKYNENDTALSYLDDLLPNLLFNTTDGCDILKYIHFEDPVIKRNDVIDELLMDLNVTDNPIEILEEYMFLDKIEFFKQSLNNNIFMKDLNIIQKESIVRSIIRFLNIFGKEEIIELFTKESYKTYINYLMAYNKGDTSNLIYLKKEIEEAIFNWKGKIQENYICVENLNKFKIAKYMDIKLEGLDKAIINKNINRFKIIIQLKFSANHSDLVDINLDYSLYEVITKLNKGYKPNKSEQKDLLLFNEFIDKLINSTMTNDYLVYNVQDDIKFKLTSELNFYSFERV